MTKRYPSPVSDNMDLEIECVWQEAYEATLPDFTDGVVEELPITQRPPDCGAPTVRMMAAKPA